MTDDCTQGSGSQSSCLSREDTYLGLTVFSFHNLLKNLYSSVPTNIRQAKQNIPLENVRVPALTAFEGYKMVHKFGVGRLKW